MKIKLLMDRFCDEIICAVIRSLTPIESIKLLISTMSMWKRVCTMKHSFVWGNETFINKLCNALDLPLVNNHVYPYDVWKEFKFYCMSYPVKLLHNVLSNRGEFRVVSGIIRKNKLDLRDNMFLYKAVTWNNVSAVKLLLENGATYDDHTLFEAIKGGSSSTVSLLLELGITACPQTIRDIAFINTVFRCCEYNSTNLNPTHTGLSYNDDDYIDPKHAKRKMLQFILAKSNNQSIMHAITLSLNVFPIECIEMIIKYGNLDKETMEFALKQMNKKLI
jgi:hypothetical protein